MHDAIHHANAKLLPQEKEALMTFEKTWEPMPEGNGRSVPIKMPHMEISCDPTQRFTPLERFQVGVNPIAFAVMTYDPSHRESSVADGIRASDYDTLACLDTWTGEVWQADGGTDDEIAEPRRVYRFKHGFPLTGYGSTSITWKG
jgi:hypothetical protein